MLMNAAGITVIIVSRGLETMLQFCLANLSHALVVADDKAKHEIVILDNASEFPYTTTMFANSGVELIRFDTHQSFAQACNIGAQRRPNNFYLLLNNDVLLAEKALLYMIATISIRPDAGICGSRLLFPDNTIQHCGVVFGPEKVGPYHCFRKAPNHIVSRVTREYQAVTGTCMLIKRRVWDELGGFDESYPFGLEDIDFCLRARQRGWRVFCCNEVDSLHFESLTPGRIQLDVPSRQLFMNKWQGRYSIDG